MSDKHLFTLYIELRDDLSALEQHTLAYLFKERPDPPQTWPAHDFFQVPRGPQQLGLGGADGFPPGAYVSAHWRSSEHPGVFSGIHVTCPNLAAGDFYEGFLPMAQWLATLSSPRGYVGAFKNQSDNEGSPWILHVYDGELFLTLFDQNTPLLSADSGEPYRWP
ncbi:MAG: hypothetical protein ACLGI6_20415 [Gammaproteobacteria bacterium]